MIAKKRGRKRKNDLYFGEKEEQAVIDFIASDDAHTKNKIYENHLKRPINKMIESIIRRYKLYRKDIAFEEVHYDTLSFLMTKFNKFEINKGKKAYSYFGTICKNYLLGNLIKYDKKAKQNLSYEDMYEALEEDETMSYTIDEMPSDLTDFISEIQKKIKAEINKNNIRKAEKKVGQALLEILSNWEIIFDMNSGNKYNKNIFLSNIREMTHLSTKDIRNGMKRFKDLYKILKEDNIRKGFI